MFNYGRAGAAMALAAAMLHEGLGKTLKRRDIQVSPTIDPALMERVMVEDEVPQKFDGHTNTRIVRAPEVTTRGARERARRLRQLEKIARKRGV